MPRPYAAVFIHGLAKKPAPDKLKELWLWGMSRDNPRPDVFPPPNRGINLISKGVPHFFIYYADVFYGEDYETELQSYYEQDDDLELLAAEQLDQLEEGLKLPRAVTPREHAFLVNFEAKLSATAVLTPPAQSPQPATPAEETNLEIASWLPSGVKKAIIKKAAMEAFYFLFDKEYERADGKRFKVRQELRSRLLGALAKAQGAGEKIVIVSHSMGTMVAYDVLRNCPECPQVDTLITLGSPLGITEVQDELVAMDAGAGGVDFPAAKLRRWINIYDRLDPVAADPKLANDYRAVEGRSVEDIEEANWGKWRHTITHYFAGTRLRRALAEAVGIA
ncbi:MAG: alpha/beta hydrolase [Betaproteobacteria bacterium]|nr:MAG: alpha/beta hydrolase [Betaproteobacteria bacterium]